MFEGSARLTVTMREFLKLVALSAQAFLSVDAREERGEGRKSCRTT